MVLPSAVCHSDMHNAHTHKRLSEALRLGWDVQVSIKVLVYACADFTVHVCTTVIGCVHLFNWTHTCTHALF